MYVFLRVKSGAIVTLLAPTKAIHRGGHSTTGVEDIRTTMKRTWFD